MIDYDLKKIRAFAFDVDGVLSPSTIPMDEQGQPLRMVNIKDGYALQLAAKLNYRIAIITGGKDERVRFRYEALGVQDIFLGAAHKIDVLQKWTEECNLLPENVLYMGDDIPDLKCLKFVGLSCAPADACPEARLAARYVSRFNGGYGCGRDVIEQVLKANSQWLVDATAFGW